jgi:hypothetical protein
MKQTIACLLLCAQLTFAWGPRAHSCVNRAAIQTLPEGLAFLKAQEEWVNHWASIPDTYRGPMDAYSKILEDPNHGWFQEQFSFLKTIPRSRYEFVLALYDEHKRIQAKEPERAKLMNVRWTGTLPYAAMESFEHIRIAMRRYRMLKAQEKDTQFTEQEIATYIGVLGHYVADAAMPLHVSIHHDGWVGENPKEYTRDPRVHGRFESSFVELIQLKEADFKPVMSPAKVLADPWTAILDHIAMSFSHVEDVYILDQAKAYENKDHEAARKLVYKLMAKSSDLLRDLTYTAWEQSGEPMRFDRANNPISLTHPRFNPATGTAPPEK